MFCSLLLFAEIVRGNLKASYDIAEMDFEALVKYGKIDLATLWIKMHIHVHTIQ